MSKRTSENITINNGRDAWVELPDFAGTIRIVEKGPLIHLAYRSTGRKPAAVTSVTIDGVDYPVVALKDSPHNAGFRNVTVRREQ